MSEGRNIYKLLFFVLVISGLTALVFYYRLPILNWFNGMMQPAVARPPQRYRLLVAVHDTPLLEAPVSQAAIAARLPLYSQPLLLDQWQFNDNGELWYKVRVENQGQPPREGWLNAQYVFRQPPNAGLR